jgi:hypothetical protein
MIPYNLILHRD